jgi:hypothetical protein
MAQATINPTDVLSVKSRVSWAAIAAGAMIALAVYFLLTLLGTAVGLELSVRRSRFDLGAGAALWAIATLLFAMFAGGWATSRLAVGESRLEATLYGVILWGVLFVGMFWMIGMGVRMGFGALMGVASGAVVVTDEDPAAAANAGAVSTLIHRYNSDLGGEKFVDDMTKLGIDRAQAEKIRAMTKEKLDAIQSGTPVTAEISQAANDPAARQTVAEIREGARKATWYTLAGVVISMAAAILGALAGSGEVPMPVPLGVRRAPSAPRA